MIGRPEEMENFLALAEVEFDVFLTVDQNLIFSRTYSDAISELAEP